MRRLLTSLLTVPFLLLLSAPNATASSNKNMVQLPARLTIDARAYPVHQQGSDTTYRENGELRQVVSGGVAKVGSYRLRCKVDNTRRLLLCDGVARFWGYGTLLWRFAVSQDPHQVGHVYGGSGSFEGARGSYRGMQHADRPYVSVHFAFRK